MCQYFNLYDVLKSYVIQGRLISKRSPELRVIIVTAKFFWETISPEN